VVTTPHGDLRYNYAMLKSIRLKNFKLHEDTLIKAAPITVFIGPNNTGKSSIFQALLLLRQAALRSDQYLCQPPGAHVPPPTQPYQYSPKLTIDLGRYEEIVRQSGDDVHFEFTGAARTKKPVAGMEQASVSSHLRVKENRLVFHDGMIEVSASQAAWEFVRGAAPKNGVLQADNVQFFLSALDTFQLTGNGGYRYDGQDQGLTLPPETLLEYNETSRWLGGVPSSLVTSVHPVFALRGFEEWGYPITDNPPPGAGSMTLHDRALALPNALAADRRLRQRLSEKLEDLLHISIDFEVVLPGKRLKIWAKHTGNKGAATLFANEGTGANQLPFIFVPVLLTPPNETVLVSEPEAHLHPKGQCDLTRTLLTVAKNENIQFFIETHSEHVLHVILNAVGKGEWAKDDIALHYFQNVEGKAQVKRLGINEHGQVDGGLPGFFEQSLRELTEFLDALKKT
jgi:hypothetical protein